MKRRVSVGISNPARPVLPRIFRFVDYFRALEDAWKIGSKVINRALLVLIAEALILEIGEIGEIGEIRKGRGKSFPEVLFERLNHLRSGHTPAPAATQVSNSSRK